MSDETREPTSSPHGLFEHYCQHPGCKLWRGYGYSRGKGEYDWFCYEHRPEATTDRSLVGASIKQGQR